MKLYQEFKKPVGDFTPKRKLISENDNINELKKEAANFLKEQAPTLEIAWAHSMDEGVQMDVLAMYSLHEEWDLVIYR